MISTPAPTAVVLELIGSAGAGQMKAAAAIGAEDVYEHVTERYRLPALPIHVVGEVQILLYLQQEGPETFALLHVFDAMQRIPLRRNAAGWRGLLKGVRRASVARSKRVVNEDIVEDRAPELQSYGRWPRGIGNSSGRCWSSHGC